MSSLERFFHDVTAREIVVASLDILIVYYIIYRVLLLIKGTRAAQMMIGIVLIGASFFIAERLEMATVSWLLDSMISYFVIIVIVIFQQDIRRGLMRLGQKVPFGRTHVLAHALDEVIEAANKLAKARMGGIVVFERDAELSDFVEHGQILDARVSHELLVALFVPSRDNELHDGAVIIDKTLRIHSAGAVLPLSRNPNLAKEFGTRHRAALGITEETDAVSIVVSEERGEMSLCFGGSIARDLETEDLRNALERLFYRDKHSRQATADEAMAAAEIGKAMAALAADVDTSRAATLSDRPRSALATEEGSS